MTFFWRNQQNNGSSGSGGGGGSEQQHSVGLPTTNGKRHLPLPRGPHSVGFIDLMTPGDPETGSFVRVLYPTEEQCIESTEKWPLWSEDDYLTGFVNFVQAMSVRWPSWAPKDEFYGEKFSYLTQFMPSAPFPTVFRMMNGTVHVPIIENAAPDSSRQWPLVVFSHGLGCARNIYSRVCYDLASYGFVVAAVEHRDGSGCLSYWLEDSKPATRNIIPHKWIAANADEYHARNKQVHHRAAEVSRALDLMTRLNGDMEGEVVKNVLDTNGAFNLERLKGIMDLSSPAICGHSFGGATTCLALAKDSRFRVGIALDAWMFPLKEEDIGADLEQPLFFINADTFRCDETLRKISEFRLSPEKSAEENAVDRRFQYIKGSVHQNTLDLPFIFQFSLVKKFVGLLSETCPETVIDLNNKLMVQFLWKHLSKDGAGSSDSDVDSDITKRSDLLEELKFPVATATGLSGYSWI